MIEVRHLTRRYGDFTAVGDLSFQVETGQTLALLGPSGCGKTTTLKMINRLIEPTSGDIFVDGEDARRWPLAQLRRRMGYVIQQTGLFPHYSVLENISTVPRLLGWEEKRIQNRAFGLLEQLGLPPGQYAAKFPAQLSGGQQQRVGIARALAADPPIVLLDEPFGALDPITKKDIRRDFLELEELARKTVILVTHDMEEAFEMANLVCLLDRGRLQQLGTPEQLLFDAANDFVERFLSGNRLQLELGTIRIGALLAYLPAPAPAAPGDPVLLPPQTTVQQAMDTLTAHQNGHAPLGALHKEGQRWVFDLPELIRAFQLYQSSQRLPRPELT